MFDIARGSGSVFSYPVVIWSQLLLIATGWGSRAAYSFHEIPSSGAGLWWRVGVLSPACSRGFLAVLLLSVLLGCWLHKVTPCKGFRPSRRLPSRLHGTTGDS